VDLQSRHELVVHYSRNTLRRSFGHSWAQLLLLRPKQQNTGFGATQENCNVCRCRADAMIDDLRHKLLHTSRNILNTMSVLSAQCVAFYYCNYICWSFTGLTMYNGSGTTIWTNGSLGGNNYRNCFEFFISIQFFIAQNRWIWIHRSHSPYPFYYTSGARYEIQPFI
jgi:hypothetical protein